MAVGADLSQRRPFAVSGGRRGRDVAPIHNKLAHDPGWRGARPPARAAAAATSAYSCRAEFEYDRKFEFEFKRQ